MTNPMRAVVEQKSQRRDPSLVSKRRSTPSSRSLAVHYGEIRALTSAEDSKIGVSVILQGQLKIRAQSATEGSKEKNPHPTEAAEKL